jgi:hypothetical protein
VSAPAPRLAAALLGLAVATGAPAQVPTKYLSGTVVRPTASSVTPVAKAWVVLHRVGPDTSRPVDSVRTNAGGSFRLRFRPFGAASAIYFLATRWDGIAYFSTPFPPDGGDRVGIVLTVFDTSSAGPPLTERGHHVIVFSPRGDGTREVVEVYDLANEGAQTRVPVGGKRPSWSAPMPATASDFRAGESDISKESISGSGGRVEVFAPFSPGVKQLSYSYRLPSAAFPLATAAGTDTLVLEVLLEEPKAIATGAGLKRVDDATVESRKLARWLSPRAPAGAPVRISVSGSSGRRMPLAVGALVIALAAMFLIAVFIGLRRRG